MLVRSLNWLNSRGFHGTIRPSSYRLSLSMVAGELQPIPAASALETGDSRQLVVEHLQPVATQHTHTWGQFGVTSEPIPLMQVCRPREDTGVPGENPTDTGRTLHRRAPGTSLLGPRNLLLATVPTTTMPPFLLTLSKPHIREKLDFFSFWLSQDDTGPLQSLLRFL